MQSQRLRGSLEMIGAEVIAGSIGIFVLMSGQPVTHAVFFRCLFGAMTLGLVSFALRQFRPGIITARQMALAVAGAIFMVLNWLLLFESYSRVSISVATTVYNVQPFMLVGLGVIFLREKVSRSQVFWLLVAFVGIALIIQREPATLAQPGQYVFGLALTFASALCYAVSAIIIKHLTGVPPHLLGFIHTAVGVVVLAPLLNWSGLPASFDSWAYLITLGVFHTGVQYILLYSAIQKLPTPITGALSFIYPVVAIVFDWISFGQILSLPQMAGISAILFGAAGLNLGWQLPARRARAS
jgi:drug/metabolite transporter (DMT)-like permease